MSCQTTCEILSNIHLLAQILGTCAFIQQFYHFHSLLQAHHVTASHSSPGDSHQVGGGQTGTKQKWPNETQSFAYATARALHSFLFVAHCRTAVTANPPCRPRPHSHHPFNLTSIYHVPALHLLPPSTPFHSLHVSKPSDPLYLYLI